MQKPKHQRLNSEDLTDYAKKHNIKLATLKRTLAVYDQLSKISNLQYFGNVLHNAKRVKHDPEIYLLESISKKLKSNDKEKAEKGKGGKGTRGTGPGVRPLIEITDGFVIIINGREKLKIQSSKFALRKIYESTIKASPKVRVKNQSHLIKKVK